MNKQRYSHYVMKKISEGESDIRKGKTLSHEEVGRRLMKLLEKAEDDIAKKQTRPMKIFLKEFKARYRISEKK